MKKLSHSPKSRAPKPFRRDEESRPARGKPTKSYAKSDDSRGKSRPDARPARRDDARGDEPRRENSRREGGFRTESSRRDALVRRDTRGESPRREGGFRSEGAGRDDSRRREDPRRPDTRGERPRREGGFRSETPRGDAPRRSFGAKAPRDFTPREKPEYRERSEHREKPAYREKSEYREKPAYREKAEFRGKPASRGTPVRRDKLAPRREEATAPALLDSNNVLLWGMHAVRAAWLNPKRRCFRLWMTAAGKASFEATLTEAEAALLKRPDAKICERADLDRLTPPNSVHQGLVVETALLPEPSLHDIISGDNPPEILIMLDQVTDPHNVGAILRSASAFGAGAIIMTERNAPGLTGVMAKSASGAVEHTPQIHVVNLARALDELQEAGYWRVGLAEEGSKDLGDYDLSGRTVLVLGAEGDGLRQLTRKKCDELARLPTGGAIGSLNVSNAAAVALYEIRRQKKKF